MARGCGFALNDGNNHMSFTIKSSIVLLVVCFGVLHGCCGDPPLKEIALTPEEIKKECEESGWEPLPKVQGCQITKANCNCESITREYCSTIKGAHFAKNDNEPICFVRLPDNMSCESCK